MAVLTSRDTPINLPTVVKKLCRLSESSESPSEPVKPKVSPGKFTLVATASIGPAENI